ncbi:MAG: helix-turn-helix transcriptional regulator [Roseicyclus sp.]
MPTAAEKNEPAPFTAARLAEPTGVSERAIYRDIAALRAAGALIIGQAGFGYTLTEDTALPPQMLTRLETEAVILGLSAVRAEGDPELAAAAADALAKITASLPEQARQHARHAGLRAARVDPKPPLVIDPCAVRHATWEERAVDIDYISGGITKAADANLRRALCQAATVMMERRSREMARNLGRDVFGARMLREGRGLKRESLASEGGPLGDAGIRLETGRPWPLETAVATHRNLPADRL